MPHVWNRRAIVDPSHKKELETAAADLEFGATRLERGAAEEGAYRAYRRRQHMDAVTHHANAVRAAVSRGGMAAEAEKHNALYALHMKALGFNPASTPPPSALVQKPHREFNKFTPHPADHLLVDSSMSKSERIDFFKYVDSDALYLSEPEMNNELSKSLRSPMALEQLHGQKVRVYFNLHNRLFSVQHQGRVVAHVPEVKLTDVKFKVSEAGRQRVLAQERKNVHAFVEGIFDHQPKGLELLGQGVLYNPYKYSTFVRTHDKSPIMAAKAAVLVNVPYPMVTVEEEPTQEADPSFIHRRGQNE